MPDVAEQPPQPTDRRGRRIYIWWAVALTLLALLGVFCWAVVVPVMQVKRLLCQYKVAHKDKRWWPSGLLDNHSTPEKDANMVIAALGGPDQAYRKLTIYVRFMRIRGIDVSNADEFLELMKVSTLLGKTPEGQGMLVGNLIEGLKDANSGSRYIAAERLGEMGASAKAAVPALEELKSDGDEDVRWAAVQALKKIRGQEPPK